MRSSMGDVVVVPQAHHDEVFRDASGRPLRLQMSPPSFDEADGELCGKPGMSVFHGGFVLAYARDNRLTPSFSLTYLQARCTPSWLRL